MWVPCHFCVHVHVQTCMQVVFTWHLPLCPLTGVDAFSFPPLLLHFCFCFIFAYPPPHPQRNDNHTTFPPHPRLRIQPRFAPDQYGRSQQDVLAAWQRYGYGDAGNELHPSPMRESFDFQRSGQSGCMCACVYVC